MADPLDLSSLDAIPEEVEEKLSPAWRRILSALRRLRRAEDRGGL